jgi:hypothetical protein
LEENKDRNPQIDRSSQTPGLPTGHATTGRTRAWLRTAADRKVVLRGLAYALVVGAILVAINHGDAILGGNLDTSRWIRIALTVVVPYCVSTASSVGATLDLQPDNCDYCRPPSGEGTLPSIERGE